jgi:hypothetical protein
VSNSASSTLDARRRDQAFPKLNTITNIEVIEIPPPKLRELMVTEAEIGEKIMRALILRRVALLEQNVGGTLCALALAKSVNGYLMKVW